eukprot:TRINITY_DN155_c0_g1_i1.p1 TRINITY_DN155_c0_g1~~TRINITY_DN155_c0_g1_i1.p1  ORF type:complete len:585 (+),score=220.76 TRINITY_DN155_c0_g1_i1:83-1756(+)
MARIVHPNLHGEARIPRGVTLTQYCFGDVGRFGDATAFIDGTTGQKLSYAGLWQAVRRTAAGLQRRGLRKGDVVSIWSPNCIDYVIAFHGVIAAGGVVTTVSPAYTAAEAARQLENSGAVYACCGPAFLDRMGEAKQQYRALREVFVFGNTVVDGTCGVATSLSAVQVAADPEPVTINPDEDVCVLPYSSGTTGLPKGTMLTHFNLVTNLVQCRYPGVLGTPDALSPKDTLLAVLPFYHIYGMVVVMNLAICCGARVVTLPGFDPPLYLRCLKQYDVTVAHVAPPLVQYLAKSPDVQKALPFPALKELFSAAAPLGSELSIEVRRRLGEHLIVRQGYGMTELSPVSHADRSQGAKLGSIGYLFPSMEARIVCPVTGKDQPKGTEKERGELWLRGPNVMKGYHANEKATKETIDSEGWLHTGDIAYIDHDSCYYIVDRLKELIKVKGYQVAPAELEALLMKHSEIADAAVIGVPAQKYGGREGDGEMPKAFVVLQPGSKLTTTDIVAWLSPQVSSYKQLKPHAIDLVPSVPKTASGKILRKDLRVVEKTLPGKTGSKL